MQHWPRYRRKSKQHIHNKGSMLTGVEKRGEHNHNHNHNQEKIDDDLRSTSVVPLCNRSSASKIIFRERSNDSVSESEQLGFLAGHSSYHSHERRLDMDSEMSVRRKNRLSEVLPEIPSQGGCFGLDQMNYATSPSTGSDISTSKIRRQGNTSIMSRWPQNKTLRKLKPHRRTGPLPSDASKAYGKTNQLAIFAEEDEVLAETALQGSRHVGESFKMIRTNTITRENRAEIERATNFEMESRVTGQIGGQGIVASCSGCFGCVSNGARSLPGERNSLSCHGSSEIASQGLRCTKGNVGSYSSGRGSSKRSLRKFSCISSGDVLPSVTNPLANDVPNHVFNRQKLGTYNTKHKIGASGLRIRKSSVFSAGCIDHGNSQIELSGLPSSGLPSEQNGNPLPGRSKRISVAAFKASKWCLKMPTSMKSDSMVSSSNGACINSAMQASNEDTEGGREIPRTSSENYRELSSPRLVGNSNRSLGLSARQSGQMETDRRNTTRTWVNYGVSNNTASFMHDSHKGSSSIFSGPPSTLRNPSVSSPLGMSERARSVEALSSPSSYTSSPDVQISNSGFHFSYASTSQSPDMSRGVSSPEFHDGLGIRPAETPVYRPFQQQSLEENQMRFTFDGISQVLSSREHAERDGISNEQFFMLEANLLFGGIASYDQHRDMRLDVDNMSYEELLALEESIGNVCTGLGKDLVSRCLKNKKYAFSHSDDNFIPEESEVKCSVCQEEFEEGVDLGVLECGHSHHFLCIEQWLLQKNLCPICKASASS